MPITLAQACDIAQKELLSIARKEIFLQLQLDETKEFDVGWIFYYQTARFLETGNFNEMLVGGVPMFVSRTNGDIVFVSYHRPLAESLAAYRACGDMSAHEIPEVRLLRGREGASVTSAIRAIRQYSTLGVVQAKDTINSCFSSDYPVVQLPSMKEAKALVLALASVGFDAEVCYSL
ncbi:MAG: hypothetical protein JO200_18095 [Comamonas sp.]|nr:hypothetical protein [Comamonas sp.]